MQKEALEYVRKCDQCQRFAPSIHQPGGVLSPLSSPWPFAQWGLDIVGPFPKAAGNKRYLLVGTDYFTKWVEAEPLANIRDANVKKVRLEKHCYMIRGPSGPYLRHRDPIRQQGLQEILL